MKATFSVQFKMDIAGETGYDNQSTVRIKLPQIGTVDLPDDWSLRILGIQILQEARQVEIIIPSGSLVFSVNNVALEGDEIIFTGSGRWDGKLNGLLGGMCGFGNFSASEVRVYEGTYMLPQDQRSCSLEQYRLRIARDRQWSTREEALSRAAYMADVIALAGDAEPSDLEDLRAWRDEIARLAAFELVDFVRAVNQKRLKEVRQNLEWDELSDLALSDLCLNDSRYSLGATTFANRALLLEDYWVETNDWNFSTYKWVVTVIGDEPQIWIEEDPIQVKHLQAWSLGRYQNEADAQLAPED